MSAICGFLGRPGDLAGPALASMLDALAPFGKEQAQWTDGAVGLGWRASAGEAVPTPTPRSDAGPALAIVADARLDDLAALCGALGVPPPDRAWLLREGNGSPARRSSLARRSSPAMRPSRAARERTAPAEDSFSGDADLIRRAWLRWGRECPKHLLGDYAFAIWDVGRRMLFCARDHIGAKPLYYARTARGFAFASAVEGVLAAPGVSDELDEGRVVAHLTEIGSATTHRTFFKAVRKLPPGCSIVVASSADAASPQRHWRPEDVPEARPASDEAWAEEFLALYREAVRDRLRGAGPVGTHLSGGLDSSSVTVLAARELERQGRPSPLAFTWLPALGGKAPEAGHAGEYALVDAVRKQEGLRVFHQSPGAADVLHLLRGDGAFPGAGFHANEYPVQRCAQEQGVRVLLSGWGGDEGVSFSGRGHPAWLLFTGRWMRLLAECHARNRRLPGFLADVLLPLVHPRSKLVLRRLLKLRWGELRDRRWLVHPDLVRRASPPPRPALPVVGMRRTQLRLLRHGGLNERMEAWAASGARRGIEYRYPLLDRRLLEFALRLPPEQFRRGRWSRWLMRHALGRTGLARHPRSCREHGEGPLRNAVLPSEVCWNRLKADPARSEPAVAALDEAFLAVRAELETAAEAPGRAACFDMPRLLERLDACRFRRTPYPEVLYNALLLLDFHG